MEPTRTPGANTNSERPEVNIGIITPTTEDRHQGQEQQDQEPGGTEVITTGRLTPPAIEEAIDHISAYKFDPHLGEDTEQDESIAAALMMFSPTTNGAIELPKLRTEHWPHGGKRPNPITIGMAKKILGAAYAEVPCELEAAGDHGYAWIIEDEKEWLARNGVTMISVPAKPKEVMEFNMKAQWEFAVKTKRYNIYKHLVLEGRRKIMEWFGQEMFYDLFVNEALPPHVTPKDLLGHIASIYATPNANRICMEQVEDRVNEAYDTKKPVEAYFKQLQSARVDAKTLGIDYTDRQIMNKALKQFELRYGRDSYKAEKKWNERSEEERTWADFKSYWKEQIQQWDVYAGRDKRKQAHSVVDIESIMENVSALRAETESLKETNESLSQQLNFHHTMQAEQSMSSRRPSDDTISTLTDQIAGTLERRLGLTSTDGTTPTREERLHIARNREPRNYRNFNGGKGKRYSSYCWKCGCNCTHWTKRCLELTSNERKKYREADFDNLMGGSTKNLDRQGKYQADFGFDGL